METEIKSRNEVLKEIKKNLRQRSGKAWSVTGGRGTAYGWITIYTLSSREVGGYMGQEERAELAALLGIASVHPQGVGIPAGQDFYQEYLDRSKGVAPRKIGVAYWD